MSEAKITVDELLSLYFDAEFCEPNEKAEREKAWLDGLNKAASQTGRAVYILKPALLRVYPQYRAKRLGKEMSDLPFGIRDR